MIKCADKRTWTNPIGSQPKILGVEIVGRSDQLPIFSLGTPLHGVRFTHKYEGAGDSLGRYKWKDRVTHLESTSSLNPVKNPTPWFSHKCEVKAGGRFAGFLEVGSDAHRKES